MQMRPLICPGSGGTPVDAHCIAARPPRVEPPRGGEPAPKSGIENPNDGVQGAQGSGLGTFARPQEAGLEPAYVAAEDAVESQLGLEAIPPSQVHRVEVVRLEQRGGQPLQEQPHPPTEVGTADHEHASRRDEVDVMRHDTGQVLEVLYEAEREDDVERPDVQALGEKVRLMDGQGNVEQAEVLPSLLAADRGVVETAARIAEAPVKVGEVFAR